MAPSPTLPPDNLPPPERNHPGPSNVCSRVISNPLRRTRHGLVLELLARMFAIALVLGLILVVLPAMVDAAA